MPSCSVVMGSPGHAEHLDESARAISSLVESAAEALAVLLPGRVTAVYVEQHAHHPAVVRVAQGSGAPSSSDYTLELRMASWLGASTEAELRVVPTFLLPWISAVRALVIPLMIDGNWRGAIVVEASRLGRKELDTIAQLEQDIAGKLAKLEGTPPIGIASERVRFSQSVRRIKTQP